MNNVLRLVKKLVPELVVGGILLVFILAVIQPMRANQGMWRIFDDVHVIRTIEMKNELLAGQFPVRFIQNFGNGGGYPLFNYYSPLTYYVSAVLVFVGTNPLNSVKLLFQVAYVIFAGGMYVYLSRGLKLSRFQALVLSIVSIYSAYFNYDAYIRGSLAELLAFSVLPLFLFGIEKIWKKTKIAWIVFSALVLSAIFLFHAITGIIISITVGVLVATRIFLRKERSVQSLLPFLFMFGLTGLVCAFYLVPAFLEKEYVQYGTAEFVKSGYISAQISLKEILGLTSFGSEVIPTTLGFGLSMLLLGFVLRSMGMYVIKVRKGRQVSSEVVLQVSYSVAALKVLFLISPASSLLWEHLSILQALQFPYRFLSALTVLSLAGIGLWMKSVSGFLKKIVLLGAIAFAAVQTSWIAQPVGYYFSDTFTADDVCSTTTWQQEYLPKDTQECLDKGTEPFVKASETLEIISFSIGHDVVTFETNGGTGTVQVSKYFFPTWKAYSQNGEQLVLYPSNELGLLTLDISAETSRVTIEYTKTPIQILSEMVSLLAVLAVVLYAGYEVIRASIIPMYISLKLNKM
ncbi:MAG: hypothetical protein H6773_01400 [Pseudomonadales bacterium]|nr:hypothetical protein [Candidatus Woesebacteria bacterium]MCB9800812.1 hypothetical protein [Pseudomonadales bacterium]